MTFFGLCLVWVRAYRTLKETPAPFFPFHTSTKHNSVVVVTTPESLTKNKVKKYIKIPKKT